MARGFFSGVISGIVVSALGLGAASVLVPLPGREAPRAGAVDVPVGSEFNQPLSDDGVALPDAESSPGTVSAPSVTAPEPDDLSSLDGADTTSAAAPVTGAAEDGLSEPQAGAGTSDVDVVSESPVLPSPQSAAPEQPMSEGELSISTDPAQPALPEIEEDSAFPEVDESTTSEGAEEDVTQKDSAAETVENPAEHPTDESASDIPEGSAVDDPAPEPEDPGQTAEVAQEEAKGTDEGASSIIGNLAPEVKTNRLPSVGDEPDSLPDPTPEDIVQEDGGTSSEQADLRPPLERYAAEFDNPGDKPLMSIILIDDGSGPVGLEALSSFPYPLSFAIDVTAPDAADKAAIYRASGFEVLAMVDLPEGAGGTDAEVAMQATLAAVPEAVAIMEGTGSGLQSSRAAAEQLAPILLDSGHGAIFFPKGLNTAQQLLAREGVPSAGVFRDFDANGQSATVIRRFLDQAAFKAGQEDAGVIMVGRLRPDTVSALLLWGLQDRASRVTLAPISALLRGG